MTRLHRVLKPNEPEPTTAGQCALAVMTKAPRAGRVKTRLIPPLTPEEAAALNVCFLRDTAAAISQVGFGARGIGCYTPSGDEAVYRDIFPQDFQLIPQRGDGFGERLICATQDLLGVGFASVCLIDSDSPAVPTAAFAEAVEALSLPNDNLVLGPSDDGGYYLIGLRKSHRRIFEQIDWSTKHVLNQTLERAAELELSVHLLPSSYDIDDRATLCRLCQQLLGPNESSNGVSAPATRKFLHEIISREGRERIWPADLANVSAA
jgi:rSAM/selenodomain-associated transferase 1